MILHTVRRTPRSAVAVVKPSGSDAFATPARNTSRRNSSRKTTNQP